MEEEYRNICNTVTLQSDKRGFFLDLAEAVETEAGEEWVRRFRNLPSHQDMLRTCLEDPKVCDIIHGTLSKVQQIFRGKASKFAKSKMEEGEHWLKKGKIEKALASTNLAVVRAPFKDAKVGKSEDFTIAPLSLWLRSEILCKLSEYQLALNDIQLALKYHLPSSFKAEAYKRMGMCYLNIGDKKKALVSLNVARSCGNTELQEECSQIIADIDSYLKPPTKRESLPVITNSLPDMPGISNSLTLCSDSKCGRFFKASVPISIGDVVAFEEPYVSALFIEKHGTHCLHCFSRLKAPIPCPNCAGVGFCSNECLSEGLKYHRWECQYLELEIGSGMSILSHVALRAITQNTLQYFKNSNYKDHPYQKFLKLEGHLKERDGQDLLRRTLMALFLLQILRHGGYFENNGNGKNSFSNNVSDEEDGIGKLNQDEMIIGCNILTNIMVLQYNSHEVYETIIPKNKKESPGKINYIGLALYLNASLFNHQCQPTLARYFNGKKIILRAECPINVGEEVSENYGPIFTMRTKDQRKKVLSGRYVFDCKCKPCMLDWPKLENMVPTTAFYRCKQKHCNGSVPDTGICQTCGTKQSLEDKKLLYLSYQEDWQKGADLWKVKSYAEAEKVTILYIRNMWDLVCQPNKNLCLAMEVLRTIWANTSGNVSHLTI